MNTEGYGFDAPACGEEEPGLFPRVDGREGGELVGGILERRVVLHGLVLLEDLGCIRGQSLELDWSGRHV